MSEEGEGRGRSAVDLSGARIEFISSRTATLDFSLSLSFLFFFLSLKARASNRNFARVACVVGTGGSAAGEEKTS